ncbi:MAG: hypothetical protein ABJN36_13870 [Cyclobacteriaceae bacterium]
MNIRKFVVCLIFIVVGTYAHAQTTRDTEAPTMPKPMYRAEKESNDGFFKSIFKKNSNKTDDETAEFRKRMKKVARKKRKQERLADKPQYSDPLYFGHKKPPKKRKNGKKKFCKQCGLTH